MPLSVNQNCVSRRTKSSLVRRISGLLAGALLLCGMQAHADLFKFKDENGVMVLSHTIPAERVKYGYDVVDEYGVLIKRVDPQLSAEAYREKLRKEAALAECKKTFERVRKLYQTEADIDYALDQGLESIDESITNLRANMQATTKQRQEYEAQAGQLDIAGRKIPSSLLDNIERAKAQERNLNEEIELRYADKLRLRKNLDLHRKVLAMRNCDNGLPVVAATSD